MATSKKDAPIDIQPINHETIHFRVLGKSPLICNAMSAKSRQQLLLPPVKLNAAAKAQRLKHDPFNEFRDSVYTSIDGDSPTVVQALSAMFKSAIKAAALDIPGTSKAQIGRLTWVEGERIPVFGDPKLFMAVTRSADVARTPDVRTRAIMPQWACEVSMTYVAPTLNAKSIANLMAAAGLMSGIGDWRPNKGAGSYGQFDIVDRDDPRWHHIVNNYGRAHQEAAFDNPVPHDDETAKLLEWFESEASDRGFAVGDINELRAVS